MGIFEKFRKNKKEVTPGGSPIYRYEEQENREFQMPAEMGRYAEEIEAQFAQLFPDHKSCSMSCSRTWSTSTCTSSAPTRSFPSTCSTPPA